MKGFLIRMIGVAVALCVLVGGAALKPEHAVSNSPLANKVLSNALEVALGRTHDYGFRQPISAGVTQMLLEQTGELNRRAQRLGYTPPPIQLRSNGCGSIFQGHGQVNVRVNQDCSLRQQPGTAIAVSPQDPSRVLVAQNDSRIGFNHCGVDWTSDGGLSWGDMTPPFWQFTLLDGRTADGCIDPSIAWDSQGNSYVAATLNDIGSNAPPNVVVVAKSDAGIGGAFFHSPDPHGGFMEYRSLPLGVPVNLNDPNMALDKPMVDADANPSSPKRDNLYLSWTRYGPEQESSDSPEGIRAVSPIFFSQSSDHGQTWTLPIEISGRNFEICPTFECYNDQGSDLVVGQDGSLYAAFANRDSPTLAEQLLFVKCDVAGWCDERAYWSNPVRVTLIDTSHPTGPSDAGCPFGRQCLPPNGYAVNEATSISLSVDAQGRAFIVWSDFRNNTNPKCRGNAETAMPPCDNDVFYAYSTDGGATWTDPISITPRSNPRFGETAQWMPWSAMAPNGHLWVAFYDRSFGDCESTGCNDVTAVEITNPASDAPTYEYHRVTSDSMPNLTLQNNPIEAGFIGDRMKIEVDSQNRAHIAWTDTRPRVGTSPEEDVYYGRVPPITLDQPPPPAPPPPPPPPPPPAPPPPPPPPPPPGPPAPPAPPPPAPPVRCRVPRVIGLRLNAAKARIRKAHCSIRAVRRVRARSVGKIVSQSPRAGARKPRGYGVRLAVGRR